MRTDLVLLICDEIQTVCPWKVLGLKEANELCLETGSLPNG